MRNNTLLILLIPALFITNITNAMSFNIDQELVEGMRLEKALSASEEHIYTISLENGMSILAEINQIGIDLVIDIHNPNGKLIKQVDSPNGEDGIEPVDFTANKTGKYKLIVRTLDKKIKKGNYVLKVDKILSLENNAKRIAKKELPTETLYNLWEASLNDKNAIDNFIKKQTEKHIIEPIKGNDSDMLITYFCVPDKDTEYAMQSGGRDFLGLRFRRLGKTKLFFVTQVVANDARFNYGFNFFKLYKAGLNGEIETRDVVHSYDGLVVMPNAPKQPYIIEKEGVSKGKVSETSIKSSFLNEERKITVYTPANYNEKLPHNLLIVFDGESYGGRIGRRARIPTPTILDNLTAQNKITPTIAILVWNMGKRGKDLISEEFSNFIAKEVIPWTRSNYNINSNSNNVIVAGSSRGGFSASYIALNNSDIIGNVLSQSGSYWIKGTKDENHWIYPKDEGKLIKAYKSSELLPIKFYMDIGLYDAGASMLGMNREFRDILEIKGYEVDYNEFNGGHSYVNWRGTFSNGLISLIGKE
ncbi:alpha/beta hydrolase [Psychroflexus sp. MES1-P1E]|uniref:alpha/beta hydrolase n=1 Tax=Psychroflexus sp. MES1-P1E TaxID=2058320 RepID=UPI000C7E3818|nr:alpha/beta hydrolase-fold protein [Psychroflexus sp. MES1-P1E]PKG42562.1 esterase [Psychroflexus sp. MES1-P1E]